MLANSFEEASGSGLWVARGFSRENEFFIILFVMWRLKILTRGQILGLVSILLYGDFVLFVKLNSDEVN